jgi:biotin carboxylase
LSDNRVLVIGTTADYIDIIRRRFPRRALFLTAPDERERATEPVPGPDEELGVDLADRDGTLGRLQRYLTAHGIQPVGITAFDCESMALTASLAEPLGLSYASEGAVAACRSKFTSKQLWRRSGVPCPDAELFETGEQAVAFFERSRGRVVIKPICGSGSELLFICSTREECLEAVATMQSRMACHAGNRMYAGSEENGHRLDPHRVFVVEEFIEGPEFSCDFIVEGDSVRILRIARKIPALGHSVGTTWAYVVPGQLPPEISPKAFEHQLRSAAHAVGLNRALCMLDFIIRDGEALLIEMAPRPGGDCLPPLLRQCSGIDMLGLALDFAERRPIEAAPRAWSTRVGMRFIAGQSGILQRIDDRLVRADGRVVECVLKYGVGHRVVLPPEDYDSRILGYAIFAPRDENRLEAECAEIEAKLDVAFRQEG